MRVIIFSILLLDKEALALIKKFCLVTGASSHSDELLCFDRALINAGVGDYNHVKVSSILPAGAQRMKTVDAKPGAILYSAFATLTNNADKTFSSAVAVGIPEEKNCIGVIMEYSGFVEKDYAKNKAEEMVKDAMKIRDIQISEIISISIQSTNDRHENLFKTTFAGLVMWE